MAKPNIELTHIKISIYNELTNSLRKYKKVILKIKYYYYCSHYNILFNICTCKCAFK